MKKYISIGIGIVLIALISVGLYFSISSSKTETFSGINGETLSVRSSLIHISRQIIPEMTLPKKV